MPKFVGVGIAVKAVGFGPTITTNNPMVIVANNRDEALGLLDRAMRRLYPHQRIEVFVSNYFELTRDNVDLVSIG